MSWMQLSAAGALVGGLLVVSQSAVAATTKSQIISRKPVPTLLPPQPSAGGPVQIAKDAAARLKHVFVIAQENHTFDNYFGTFPGADGFPAGLQIPIDPANPPAGVVKPAHLPSVRTVDLDHSSVSSRAALDGGKMDGFVKAQAARNLPGELALGYYDGSDLGYYWYLAKHYVLCDRFFSSAQGGSLVNHQYLVAARASGFGESVPVNGVILPTIFDRLDEKQVSWKFYVKNYDPTLTYKHLDPTNPKDSQVAWVPPLTMPTFVNDPQRFNKIVDLYQLFDDLTRQTTPAVSYIIQGGTSEHPPGDVVHGQDAVVSIITSIMRSPEWKSSAIILTWDDWGGWYDHVLPPQIDADGYGFRVPTLVISPFAKAGYVDHTTYDFTSILKFIERLYGLAPLTTRDEKAADLLDAFNFAQPPRVATPPFISGVTDDVRRRGPRTETLVAMYTGTSLLALILVGAAVVRRRPWRLG